MAKYRKKPVVIDAVLFTGDLRSVAGFLPGDLEQDFLSGVLTVLTLSPKQHGGPRTFEPGQSPCA